ncbi:MAG: hypothetical protein ABW069_16290, partial [Duganella sp.]
MSAHRPLNVRSTSARRARAADGGGNRLPHLLRVAARILGVRRRSGVGASALDQFLKRLLQVRFL